MASDITMRTKIKELIAMAPKVQLHLHLDGSLSFQFICTALKRLKERNKNIIVFEKDWEPSTEEELITWFRNLKKVNTLQNDWKVASGKNWNTFTICNYFLQTKIDLFEATYDVVTRMSRQHNVNYIEIRFAPVLHTNEGLTEKEAVSAALDGFTKATSDLAEESLFVNGGIIVCGLRSFPVLQVIETVKLIHQMNDDRILGFDIAGDEGSYPLKLFEEAIKLAIHYNIKTTVHAGEWNPHKHKDIINNLRLAVDLGVDRIGHGLALKTLNEDDEIFSQINAKNISVEICLTANCGNPDKCASFKQHPLPWLLENNVNIAGLNVDNLLLSGSDEVGCPNPSGEYVRALFDCGVRPDQMLKIIDGSYRAAFKPLSETFIADMLKVWKEKILPNLHV